MKLKRAVMMGLTFLALAGCGGGGGGSQPATRTVVKLSTQGNLSQGTAIAGIGVTVTFPEGITVQTDSSGAVASGVVVPSGGAAQATVTPPVYTPATASAKGTLSFVLASSQSGGFGAGEFVTVTADITAGTSPDTTKITLSDFKPVDQNGAAIAGLTASSAVTFE